jgi:hypothetical protein
MVRSATRPHHDRTERSALPTVVRRTDRERSSRQSVSNQAVRLEPGNPSRTMAPHHERNSNQTTSPIARGLRPPVFSARLWAFVGVPVSSQFVPPDSGNPYAAPAARVDDLDADIVVRT